MGKNKLKIIDVHAHLTWVSFDTDRDDVIYKMKNNQIGAISVGVDLNSSLKNIKLAEQYKNIWATVGVHPHSDVSSDDLKTLNTLATNDSVVAIGETGLDYFKSDVSRARQQEIFQKHIDLALSLNKPLMIHTRDVAGSFVAYHDAYNILEKYKGRVHPHFHFYAGDIESTRTLLDLGATFSFTGVITFSDSYNNLLQYLPKTSIMVETDSPFVAPVPYRGERNDPTLIPPILNKIADIWGVSQETCAITLRENTRRVFGI